MALRTTGVIFLQPLIAELRLQAGDPLILGAVGGFELLETLAQRGQVIGGGFRRFGQRRQTDEHSHAEQAGEATTGEAVMISS